jgi:hypothetical protein
MSMAIVQQSQRSTHRQDRLNVPTTPISFPTCISKRTKKYSLGQSIIIHDARPGTRLCRNKVRERRCRPEALDEPRRVEEQLHICARRLSDTAQ